MMLWGNQTERIDYRGDDVERLGLLALCLAVLNQAAEDVALAELRSEPGAEVRRAKAASTLRCDVAKRRHFEREAEDARRFLGSPDAVLVCEVAAAASLGKVRLAPEWILGVQVPALKRRCGVSVRAAVERWEGTGLQSENCKVKIANWPDREGGGDV